MKLTYSKRTTLAILALALSLMFPSIASAATYTMNSFSPTSATAVYDWTSSQQIISITGSANATGSGLNGKFVFWDFNPAVGSRTLANGTETIAYDLYKYPSGVLGNELWAWSQRPTKDNVYSITLSGQQSNMTFNFAIIPEAKRIKRAGTYTGTIVVGYYTGTLSGTTINNASQRTSASLGVALAVPVICDLSILPSGITAFDAGSKSQLLDFGAMAEGESRALNAVLCTNSNSWTLAVSSTNGGRMKNSGEDATIPYSFSYNGTLKPLSTISTVIESGSWTSTDSGYAVRPLTFTLEDTFNVPGTYTDNLTFELTAQ
jgi:hypothetical protein